MIFMLEEIMLCAIPILIITYFIIDWVIDE